MDAEVDSEAHLIQPGMAPKLSEWENEPTAQDLQEDLEASRPAHDSFMIKVKKWRDLHAVEGSAAPAKTKGRSQIQPKLVRRQAEWRYAALSEPFNSSENLYDIKPVTFEDVRGALQNKLVINHQFRTKINRVNFIDNYVRANVDEGAAIVRVGWDRITKEVEEEVPVWTYLVPEDEEHIQQMEAGMLLKQEDPRTYEENTPEEIQEAINYFEETGQISVAVQTGTDKVIVEKIIDNRPTLSVVNPENFYFDPSCGDDFTKASFAILSFETSQHELLKEPNRYKNLKYVNWEGASSVLEPNHAPQSTDINFNFKDPMRKRVVAFEYWGLWDINKDGNLVPIVATWIGDILVRLEENPFPDGLPPFVVATYMPIKRQLLGEPDAELLEDNQKILGAVSRGMIDLLGRSANSQQGFAKGMLDVVNKRRYENGQDYEFNPNMHPAQGIIEHKYPEIPQSALAMLSMQNQEAEALTGVKAFSGGLSGNAYGDVATGIKGILDAASKREMGILRRLADGIETIGRKIIAMNAVFLSEEEVIRVTNSEFITVRRDELAGEYDLEVDISTAEIDNAQAQDLGFMLQTMGNSLDFEMTKLILIKIARLKRMPDLAKQIENFSPEPDPIMEQLKQLEVQKAMKEIEKLDSEIALNHARAQREAVQAEQGALDTVEQETGTSHARELERHTAQSTGNQNLEITKSLLKPRKYDESEPEIEAAIGFNEISKQLRDSSGGGYSEPQRSFNRINDQGEPENMQGYQQPLDSTLI